MNDCGNAEIRDRLPDLLHDQLDAQTRAVVVAHVERCVDCRAELELLRGVRETLARHAPRVDVGRVAGALPKPPLHGVTAGGASNTSRRRRVWSDWRVAAAVTLFVAGGSSLLVLDRNHGLATLPADTVQVPSQAVAAAAADDDDSAPMPGTGRRLENLNEQQLKKLLDAIGQMQAVPLTDPEPVTLRVDGRGTAMPEEQ